MCVCVCVDMYVRVHVCMCACMCVYVYIFTFIWDFFLYSFHRPFLAFFLPHGDPMIIQSIHRKPSFSTSRSWANDGESSKVEDQEGDPLCFEK